MISLRSLDRRLDRRVVIVAVTALVLVIVIAVVGAVLSAGNSDSDGASPGGATSTTAGENPTGSGPTSPATDVAPPKQIEVRDPIGLEQTGDFDTGLVVKIMGIRSVQSQVRAPGDIAGPALRVELEATNASREPISLKNAQVGLEYGSGRTPASTAGGPNVKVFSRSLAAGSASSAAYVFRVPPDERDRIRVVVSYSLDAPTIVFEGSAT